MDLKDQLTRDEGRVATLYYDTLNNPTIGIGRNLKRPLSDDEIDYLYHNDIITHSTELLTALPWIANLDEVRRNALINMAFNMGVPGLLKFKNMLTAMNNGDWDQAAKEVLNSLWHDQVGRRSFRISEQIRTGIMQ